MLIDNLNVSAGIYAGGTVTATTFSGNLSGSLSDGSVSATTGSFSGNVTLNTNKLAFTTVGGDNTAGIMWNGATDFNYSITRTSGGWDAPNYQQLQIKWVTGMILDAGNGTYGRSYVGVNDRMAIGSSYYNSDTKPPDNGLVVEGNVGIGTSSPGCKLHVSGAICLESEDLGLFGVDSISDSGNRTKTYIKFAHGGTGSDWAYLRQIGASNGNHLALDFHDDGADAGFSIRDVQSTANPDTITTRFIVERGGDVGIGTGDPSYKLHVVGDIYASGDVIMFSDERKKTDIEPIPNALEKVLQLRGVTFNKLDDDDHRRHAGVIAQEVEKVLPEVVYTDEHGTKSVAYGNMIGLLIEAIKELAKK